MDCVMRVARWPLVASAVSIFLTTNAGQAAAQAAPANRVDQPWVTIAAGPTFEKPAGDHGFQNTSGFGGFVLGTVRLGAQFSLVARYATAESPKLAAIGAVDRRSNTLDGGINYFIANPSDVRVIVMGLAGKHDSVPVDANAETDSAFGVHVELDLQYFPHHTFGFIGGVGYSYAWATRLVLADNGRVPAQSARVDFSFEMLTISLGLQARI